MFQVRALRKTYPDFILEADFSAEAGECVGISAPSGSGKTTLLRLIAGLESLVGPGDGGRIELAGRDLTRLAPEHRNVGLVFQDFALFPHLDARENVAYSLSLRGVDKSDRLARADAWLERLGLSARRRSHVHTLSGGERQRVAFARALIAEPSLLLLDEPFSALDSVHRGAVRDLLATLPELKKIPVLLVTHDETDLQKSTTRVLRFALSADGRVRSFAQ